MVTCQWCEEEVGEARRCPNCGRIQYRYALDGGTDDAAARTAASDAEQDRIDDLYGNKDEVLEEIVEMLGKTTAQPPPMTETPRVEHRPPPPAVRASRTPSRVQRSSPLPDSPEPRKAAAGCFTLLLFIGLGVFFFVTVTATDGSGDLAWRGGSVAWIIPLVIGVSIIRRRLRDRGR